MKKTVLSIVLSVSMAGASYGENWGHWRGPTGNGTSLSAKPPTTWNSKQNVKWKVEIPGRGSSSPVVWGDRVIITSAVPTDPSANPVSRTKMDFRTLCYDRSNGKLLWEKTAATTTPHQDTHATNGFASASPCTDGEHIYSHFGSRGLYCYTMDGELVWKRDDFGQMKTRNDFGEGSSPVLEGNMLIVPWDHEGPSALYALDKKTGKTIWKTDRDEPTCWATPHVVDYQGKKQVVMNGQKFARGYDLETGKELWKCSGQTERPCATAVSMGELAFVGSGFRGAFMGAFRLAGKGDLKGTDQVAWTINEDTPDVASPILSEGRIYFYKGKSGQLTCVDAKTGKALYKASRIPGVDSTYASPVAAGGHVYLTARNGTTVVIEDAPVLKVVSTNSVDETVDATPAVADSELFLRGEKHLFCIGS